MIIPTKVQAANNPQGTEYYIWKDKVTTDAEGNTPANTGLFTVTESGGVTTITLEQDITGCLWIGQAGTYILDANGKTVTPDGGDNAIDCNLYELSDKTINLTIIGNGTFNSGSLRAVYFTGSNHFLTIDSGTFNKKSGTFILILCNNNIATGYTTIVKTEDGNGNVTEIPTLGSELDAYKIVFTSYGPVNPPANPTPNPGNNNQNTSENNKTYTHTHNFQWIVTTQPTEKTDGCNSLMCEGCGAVEATQPISYFNNITNNVMKEIKGAPENGTVTIDNEFLRCFSNEMVEELLARPDLTVVVNFTDKGVNYSFTIPAGKAPTDGQEWYGYYYLGSVYGWTLMENVM